TYTFTFRGLTGNVVSPDIDTNISIDFGLEATTPHCDLPDNVRITIGKTFSSFQAPACIINYAVNETCHPPISGDICQCLPQKGWYRLSKTIEEADYTSWVWRTNTNNVETAIINITSNHSIIVFLDPALNPFHSNLLRRDGEGKEEGGGCSAPATNSVNFPNPPLDGHQWTKFIINATDGVPQFADVTEDTDDTGVSKTAPSSTTKPKAASGANDESRTTDIWSGTGAIVITCVVIVGITATVITIIVVRAKKDRRHYDSQPRPRTPTDDHNNREIEERHDAPAYHLYSEIPDNISPPAAQEAAPNDGYLTPLPSRAAKQGADGIDLISSARVSSEDVSDSYERPVNPDYTTPNPVYQPLRHLYETVRQWRHSKRDSRSLDQEK
ncbi:hypothetical protein BaRGS_00035331, partial [Batillaria attramentaria]